MANCKKYTRAACGHLFKHYERAKDENGEYIKFGNQDIDISRTHLNYNLAPMQANGQGGFIRERCSEVKMQNRKDVNVMCSWVVTAPKEIKEEETAQFFKETYKFLSERYGRDNIVSAYVHMDEVTPHIHFAFVPVVRDKKKDILKVSAKEAVDKWDLQKFHQDLSGYMENIFGRDVGILNEATKEGNRTKEQLRYEAAQRELAEITREIQKSKETMQSLKKEEKNLDKKIKDLESTFESEQLTMKKIEKIQPIKGWFGLKNVKMDDIESLKAMAMLPLQDRKALNVAKQEIERLKIENAEQKKKIPTMAQEMARNEQIIKLQDKNKDLQSSYNYISGKYNRVIEAVNELPDEEREKIRRAIEPPADPNERNRSDEYEL